jgi:histidyl-tRNA synthetase
MANKSKFQAIRGTRDLLPPETALWNRVEETARQVFATFGFGEIRLPIFEETQLFVRSIGVETDVVAKEMYTFLVQEVGQLSLLWDPVTRWRGPFVKEDHRAAYKSIVAQFLGEYKEALAKHLVEANDFNSQVLKNLEVAAEELQRAAPSLFEGAVERVQAHAAVVDLGYQVTLRPEATASVCRAYIEHNMQQLPQPIKLYYLGPMFRRERPQKGRYRQFYQIGAEVLGGSDAPAIDAEVIEMVMTFFDRLQLPGVQLDINSIGHAADNCRRGYVAALKSALEKAKDQLGADSQRRIETNPLRVLDSKLEHEQPIIETLPRIADHLCDDCKAHYAAVKHQLQLRGVVYKENWRLVRGLDYYMRTTFEITAQGLGSQNAVCGGGRYDGLVELLGGPPTKGIGFAIGEDRLILSLQEGLKSQGDYPNPPLVTRHSPLVYIAWMGERAYAAAIRAAKDLRNAAFSVELPPTEQKFGKALERASKLGSRYALILGDNEVAEGSWTLKALADGSQQKFTEPELLDFLKRSV